MPAIGPGAVGAKTIVRLQAALAARVVVQELSAIANPGLTATFETVSGTPPLLVRVSVCASAVSPTPVAGKLSETGVSETPGAGDARAAERDGLVAKLVGDGERRGAGADRRWREGDVEGAGRMGRQGVAAGIDDREVAGRDAGGDQRERDASAIGEGDGLSGAGRADLLLREAQRGRGEGVGGGRFADAGEARGLGRSGGCAGVIGYGKRGRARTAGRGGEGDRERAAGVGREGCSAGVGEYGKVAGVAAERRERTGSRGCRRCSRR